MIDLHIHGTMGRDFIEGNQEAVDAVSRDVVRDGVTSYAASLTVLSHTRMLEVVRGLAATEAPRDGARFLGIHSEGPFISKEYKALMDERYIRAPNVKEMEEMIRAASSGGEPRPQGLGGGTGRPGSLILMTFSPHYENFPEIMELGKKHHIAMMIGHSAANCAQAIEALDRGAAGYTHFYNAMSPHHHRNEGVVTAGFVDRRGYTELIADTVHVSERVLRFTYGVLTSKRIILVTDAMPGKSMADGTFTFSNLESIKKDGKAYVKATGRLAGSVIGLNEALRNMKRICQVSDNELVEMACVNPAKLLGRFGEIGSLEPGKKADIAVFNDRYDPVLTIVDGRIVRNSLTGERLIKTERAIYG
ncbi:N-acetylglucosamine-6-phosphate deacetylase [Spirochaetia bacterium]|nr:N-acetylglucosamine-6-phosphate deacetylase [Spirochaetia bacterium]